MRTDDRSAEADRACAGRPAAPIRPATPRGDGAAGWVSPSTSLTVLAWAVGVFLIGYWVFKRHEKGLAEAL